MRISVLNKEGLEKHGIKIAIGLKGKKIEKCAQCWELLINEKSN